MIINLLQTLRNLGNLIAARFFGSLLRGVKVLWPKCPQQSDGKFRIFLNHS